MDISKTSWQERYHSSGIFTLRCRLLDQPGMLGRLTNAIGQADAHIGTINVVGLDSQHKIRDITVYCSDKVHLQNVVNTINSIQGIEVLNLRDDVLEMHRRGTIKTISRLPINTLTDMRMLYTPGVASVCNRIIGEPDAAWELTGICDRVAIVTNGTAVLGLGNIGVLPALPVMEGKAAIFAEFADISAVPILVDSAQPQAVIDTVLRISKSFGAIQLEDISAPECFEIEEKLSDQLDIPVLHDDQHGTAVVALAALINALNLVSKEPADCTVLILGAGAAGYAIAQMLVQFGLRDVLVYDSYGPLYRGRTHKMNKYKQCLADITNKQNRDCPLAEGFKDKDIFIGVAKPNLVSKQMISSMADKAIVFPLSNPTGEISIDQALEAGAVVAVDGRTINNALAYPGIFRGALDVHAKRITLKMKIAAANQLAQLAAKGALLPDMLDKKVHRAVAGAVTLAYHEST